MWASAPTGRNHRTSRKSGAGPGGHTGRPYGKTGGGSVGADFISARPHQRVGCTHPVGADVGIGPYGAEPSNLAKIGSRSGRPYRPPLRGNRRRGRRGGLYGRPCAPTCWMHHRRTHPARHRQQKHHRRTYPLWGRVRRWCEIPRAGGACTPTDWLETSRTAPICGWRRLRWPASRRSDRRRRRGWWGCRRRPRTRGRAPGGRRGRGR